MMPPPRFANPIEASSYLHPYGGKPYATLRTKVVETATAMGYDPASMTECGINWSEDQDPFNHVTNATYPRYMALCNFRVFETFADDLKEKYEDLMNARGIGVIVKTYVLDLKRPTKYPDSLIVANRITEVLPDRYYGITTMWSLLQQAVVAEMKGYVVFFDYHCNKPADLTAAGGRYTELHRALKKRAERGNQLAAEWLREHPKKVKAKM